MIGLALAAAMAAGAPASAEVDPRWRCHDEWGRDLCGSAENRRTMEAFGARLAGELAADGVSGVRVFAVSGQGTDQPMVSILRRSGEPAVLEIRSDAIPGGQARSQPATAWQAAVADTLVAVAVASPEQARVKPTPANEKGEILVCLHAWMVVVEAIDGGKVTRRVRNACESENPVFDGAFSLATLAVEGLAGCAQLSGNRYRNDWARLFDCARISGDEPSEAADVINAIGSRAFAEGDASEGLPARLAPDIVLAEAGRPDVIGPAAVAARWRAATAAKDEVEFILFTSAAVSEAEGVRAEGLLVRRTDHGRTTRIAQAPWTQIWSHDPGGQWRVARWTIGAFEDVPAE